MELSKIRELAQHLEMPLLFVGYMEADGRINVDSRESAPMDDPQAAFERAKEFVAEERRTGLCCGVRAEIGSEVVVTHIDGFD